MKNMDVSLSIFENKSENLSTFDSRTTVSSSKDILSNVDPNIDNILIQSSNSSKHIVIIK